MSERFSVGFPASAKHLAVLREWCRVFLKSSLAGEALENLALAVSEACANNIEHCLGGDPGRRVEVEFEVARSRVRARVRNYCLAAVAHRVRPPRQTSVRPRGLGLKFITQSVDRMEYVDQGDGFLTLVLTMNRRGRGH